MNDDLDYITLDKLLPKDPWWKRALRKFGLYKVDTEQQWALIEQQILYEAQLDVATIREYERKKSTRRLHDLVHREG